MSTYIYTNTYPCALFEYNLFLCFRTDQLVLDTNGDGGGGLPCRRLFLLLSDSLVTVVLSLGMNAVRFSTCILVFLLVLYSFNGSICNAQVGPGCRVEVFVPAGLSMKIRNQSRNLLFLSPGSLSSAF